MDFLHWGSKTPLEGCFYVIHYVVLKIIYSFFVRHMFYQKISFENYIFIINERKTNEYFRTETEKLLKNKFGWSV